MGRLIDADKLKAQFTEPADWLDINQTLVHKTGIWAEIDAAETVEAIPVDWIEAQIPGSPEFYAVVTTIILRHLIDKYTKEQNNDIY